MIEVIQSYVKELAKKNNYKIEKISHKPPSLSDILITINEYQVGLTILQEGVVIINSKPEFSLLPLYYNDPLFFDKVDDTLKRFSQD